MGRGACISRPCDLQRDVVGTKLAVADHRLLVADDGSVGRNDRGQLGLGGTANRGDDDGEMGDALPFVDLGADETAVAISCGGSFSCVLLKSGGVKCWGNNSDGQLGQGDAELRGDAPDEMGDALPPIDLGSSDRVVEIDAGLRHACVLFETGKVKCWGQC